MLFLTAALHKLRDLNAFSAVFRDYRILPGAVSMPAAAALAASELAVSLALLIPSAIPNLPGLGPLAALLLLALYSAAIGLNLLRGRRHIDCGCMGPGREERISGWLMLRNAGLAVPALLLLGPETPRMLGWVDILSVGAGVGMSVILWLGAHQIARSGSISLGASR